MKIKFCNECIEIKYHLLDYMQFRHIYVEFDN